MAPRALTRILELIFSGIAGVVRDAPVCLPPKKRREFELLIAFPDKVFVGLLDGARHRVHSEVSYIRVDRRLIAQTVVFVLIAARRGNDPRA